MCCTRSQVSGSRSMYSSSTPSVYLSPFPKLWSRTLAPAPPAPIEPLPVIDGGKICFMPGSIPRSATSHSRTWFAARTRFGHPYRFSFDFYDPTSVEQLRDDPRRSRASAGERLAVRAADVVDVRRLGHVDARAHDVVQRRPRFGERALD